MKCELLFSYELENNDNIVSEYISKKPKSIRIICDNESIHNKLKKDGYDSKLWSEIAPNDGPIAEKSYQDAKKLQKQYLQVLEKVRFNDYEVIKGFDYSLLMQLTIFTKIKIILEEKIDTIFIFSSFFDIYFAIIKFAKKYGYLTDENIGMVKNEQIEFFSLDKYKKMDQYQKEFSQRRMKKFVQSISGDASFFNNLKNLFKLGKRVFVYGINSMLHKITYSKKQVFPNPIIKKIGKKIKFKADLTCAFFVTTTREDLYLKPWYTIFEKLKNNHQEYAIFTSDLATTMLLSKEKIDSISLFDEIKIIQKELRNNTVGFNIKEQIFTAIREHPDIFGLNELSSYFVNQALKTISILIICEYIITKFKVKSTIAIADGEMLENIALQISRKHNVPNFSLLPVAIFPQPLLSDWFHAEKIFIHGEEGVGTLKSLGYDENKLILTGNPRYDYIKKINTHEAKKELEKIHKIESLKKLVVVAMGRYHKNDEVWISKLIRFVNKNNFEIIIKIHPMYKRDTKKDLINLSRIRNECKNEKFLITYDMDVTILLAAADLVITDYSSIGLETIYLEKPLITVNFIKEKLDYVIRYQDYEAALYFDDYSKMESGIMELFESNVHEKSLEHGRKKFIDKFNFKNDGNAGDRIFQHIVRKN